MKENTIRNMEIGQSGFIVCWGMWVDLDGNCFLNESYDYHDTRGGTIQLKITRVYGGYIAHIHEMESDYKWEGQSGPTYATAEDMCYGKVIGFGRDKNDHTSSVTLLSKLVSMICKN